MSQDNKRNKKYGPNDSENCQIGSSARHHPLGCKHYIDMLRRIVALHDAEAAVARLKKELEEMGDELDEANWKITKLKAKAKK